jgi:predicted nucleotidyltransferase
MSATPDSKKQDALPPVEISAADWAEVTRILHTEVPSMEVWAFGSRARRDAKPYSDLDLALLTTQPMSLAQSARLTNALESSNLTIRVDVVDWASTSETFREIIRRDKVLVQHAAPDHSIRAPASNQR